jgi:hypothetical protein
MIHVASNAKITVGKSEVGELFIRYITAKQQVGVWKLHQITQQNSYGLDLKLEDYSKDIGADQKFISDIDKKIPEIAKFEKLCGLILKSEDFKKRTSTVKNCEKISKKMFSQFRKLEEEQNK